MQAGLFLHISPQLCKSSVTGELWYPDHTGTAGPQWCKDNHGLHLYHQKQNHKRSEKPSWSETWIIEDTKSGWPRSPELQNYESLFCRLTAAENRDYLMSVTFFSFFNRRGREEGTESAEPYIISSVFSASSPWPPRLSHPQVSGRKTQKGYTLILWRFRQTWQHLLN